VAYGDRECISHIGWPSLTVTRESDPIVIPIRQSFQYDTRSDLYQQFSNSEGYITFTRTAIVDFSQTGVLDICQRNGSMGCMCHPAFSTEDSRDSLILKLVDPSGVAWDLGSPFIVNASTHSGLVLMAHVFDSLTYAYLEGMRTFSLLALVCVYIDMPNSALVLENIYNKTVTGPIIGRTISFSGEWRQQVSYPLPSPFHYGLFCMNDVLTTTCRDGHLNDSCIVPYSCDPQLQSTARLMVKVVLQWPFLFNSDHSSPLFGPYIEFSAQEIHVQTFETFHSTSMFGSYYPKELVCPTEPLNYGNTPTSVTFVFDVGDLPSMIYVAQSGHKDHIKGIPLSSITTRWINIERYPYCNSNLIEMCSITQHVPSGSFRPLSIQCTTP
jgi:hypothetical protein